VTDGLNFSWMPSQLLSNPNVKNPFAFPIDASTTFTVTASIGKCSRSDNVIVRTVPYPLANAGNDTTVCFGTNIPLFASGGSSYSWSPTFFLTNPNINNPISIAPPRTLEYIVTVTDVLGCPKPVRDTVRINVTRIVASAGPRDTAIVLGQPLQLNASGGQFYTWSPSTFLNDTDIPNPISNPTDSITYFLRVSDSTGCFGLDTITVRVFRLPAGLYVPTAFTPNGNGLNDVFRPIALGIRNLEYFRVYNRWGELVYQTSEIGKGWDGNYKGREQGTSAFVWQALATDFTGKRIFKKGSVVLIK
jgi:gliding motility-associated-like protein